MKLKTPLHILLGTLIIINPIFTAADEEMTVDMADSLDIDEFHGDNETNLKIWEQKQNKQQAPAQVQQPQSSNQPYYYPVNQQQTYQQQNTPYQPPQRQQVPAQNNGYYPASAQAPARQQAQALPGQTVEIRTPFTVRDGVYNVPNAVAAIQNMHRQMAAACPTGWRKHDEWTETAGADFMLYYAFTCNN